MLTPHDDYPIHQTPLPIAHTLSGSQSHYDRYWFNGYPSDGSYFFAVAMGHYPNRGVIDGALSVVVDGVQRSVYVSGRMPLDRATNVGPMRIEVVQPLRTIRVVVDENEHGVSGDITFHASTFAVEEPRQTTSREGRVQMDSTRLTQWGRWSGWLKVDGQRIDLDPNTTYATRDRSWGERAVSGLSPVNAAPMMPQIAFMWAPLHFSSCCLHAMAFERGDGYRWMEAARYVPHLATADAPTWGEDPSEHLNGFDIDLTWKRGTREMSAARLKMNRLDGSPIEVDFEPLFSFRMRGIGYHHPEFGHGSVHGELRVGGEELHLESLDPRDYTMIHVQTLSRLTSNLGEGMGVLEQLFIGDHRPTGLAGLVDGFGE